MAKLSSKTGKPRSAPFARLALSGLQCLCECELSATRLSPAPCAAMAMGCQCCKVRLRTASWQLHRSACGLLAVLRWLLRSECRCAQDDGRICCLLRMSRLGTRCRQCGLAQHSSYTQMWMTYFMARSPGHVKGPADAARGFPVYVSPLFRGSMLPKTL